MRNTPSSLHCVLSSEAQGLRSGERATPPSLCLQHLHVSSLTRLDLPALVRTLAVSLDSDVSSYSFFVLVLPLLGFYYAPMTLEPCPWPGTISRFS